MDLGEDLLQGFLGVSAQQALDGIPELEQFSTGIGDGYMGVGINHHGGWSPGQCLAGIKGAR
jgi:hypothetical protein